MSTVLYSWFNLLFLIVKRLPFKFILIGFFFWPVGLELYNSLNKVVNIVVLST